MNNSGKGSKPRPIPNYKQFINNWDEINWNSAEEDLVYCCNCHNAINRIKLRDYPELFVIYPDGQVSCKNCNFN